ncbi:hypothetical protein GCM10011506_29950 [Marivirga lumbricoides]|uniref:PD-(D/E)XK nuclease family protein n=1 Tax=Marivirga lumbricoides TaxID=1046115 RepID=A0ABQ1ML79_9BACT|nr:hypothetical protein GCM10011506_29950 [Marivirga lumbricoides]
MRPNIFENAPGELSQDAFLSWLAQWSSAIFQQTDYALNELSTNFITFLIRKSYPNYNEPIKSLKVIRQHGKIDISLIVNDEFYILIEDKVYADENNDQLTRYLVFAENYCATRGLKVVPIYLRIINESLDSLHKIKEKKYNIVSREDLLNIFAESTKIENDIFRDYKNRLEKIQAEHQFDKIEVIEWNVHAWMGFYTQLEKVGIAIKWHFVNNPSKRFLNALLSWDSLDGYPVYIQIEEGDLVFKISTHPDDTSNKTLSKEQKAELRNNYSAVIINKAKQLGLVEIFKPKRMGIGNWMSLAKVSQEDWLTLNENKIDLTKTTMKLQFYKNFTKKITSIDQNNTLLHHNYDKQ